MPVPGLPENPASSLVCAHLMLAPLVTWMAEIADPYNLEKAILAKDLPENGQRQGHLRGVLETGDDGQPIATPSERQDSSLMKVFTDASCLIIRPPNVRPAQSGAICDVPVLRP